MISQWLEFERRSDRFDFHVLLSMAAVEVMARESERYFNRETGGVLIGHYSKDLTTAYVTTATPPPSDSKHRLATFTRGTHGLKSLLVRFWKENRKQYIGEWHCHPYSSPAPSNLDLQSMAELAKDHKSDCSNPILVIVGGDAFHLKQLVFVGVYSAELGELIHLKSS